MVSIAFLCTDSLIDFVLSLPASSPSFFISKMKMLIIVPFLKALSDVSYKIPPILPAVFMSGLLAIC